jgi:hypothetical protein
LDPDLWELSTDHVVTPVEHGFFEVTCTTVRFAEALKSFDAEKLFLFLLSDTTYGTPK